MKIKFPKVIVLTLALAISLYSTVAFAQPQLNNVDDVYTLKKIITSNGEVKVFDDGGELIIKNEISTLKTSTKEGSWNMKDVKYEIINNELHQIYTETFDQYIFEKIN